VCFARRTPVIVEAMTAIVLADAWLMAKAYSPVS
jgi:chorismate synthase